MPASSRRRTALSFGALFLAGAALGSAGAFYWHGHSATARLQQVASAWRDDFAPAIAGYGIDRCGVYMLPDTSWRPTAPAPSSPS